MVDKVKKIPNIAPKQQEQPAPVKQDAPSGTSQPPSVSLVPSPVSQSTPQQSRSSSGNCCLIGGVVGCGCLLVIVVSIIIIAVVGIGMAQRATQEGMVNYSQTTTGVPMPIITILERFIGRNKDGQKFIQFLKEGLPPDGFSESSGSSGQIKKNTLPEGTGGSGAGTDQQTPSDSTDY